MGQLTLSKCPNNAGENEIHITPLPVQLLAGLDNLLNQINKDILQIFAVDQQILGLVQEGFSFSDLSGSVSAAC